MAKINNMIINKDCLEHLKTMETNSVDAIVTDPPYGLSFMGKHWDYDVPSQEIWEECLRVLKPGGYLLAFAGTRTQHRMAVRIEDAGFEIRDMIFWTYASGFPKSLNIWKQLKKKCECGIMEEYEKSRNERGVSLQQEAEHDMRFMWERNLSQSINSENEQREVLQPGLSEQNSQVQQPKSTKNIWGEKSFLEGRYNNETTEGKLQRSDLSEVPERVSVDGEKRRIHNATQTSDGSTLESATNENGSSTPRRPQSEQQQYREPCAFCKQHFAQAIRAYGFGSAIKPACEPITLARKPISEKNLAENVLKWGTGGINIDGSRVGTDDTRSKASMTAMGQNTGWNAHNNREVMAGSACGRFPANFIHDGSDEVVELFPNSKSSNAVRHNSPHKSGSMAGATSGGESFGFDDSGSSARFFYCAKASKSERNRGCEGLEEKVRIRQGLAGEHKDTVSSNSHPTVKPIALMEYLVNLVSRPGAKVLDPFAGSGSTGIACNNLGREYILIERDPEYCKIIEARLAKAEQPRPTLWQK